LHKEIVRIGDPYASLTPRARIPHGSLAVEGSRQRRLSSGTFAMADLIYLGIGVAAFAAMALFTVACDRL